MWRMVKSTKYKHCSCKQIARVGESGCLLKDDDGAMCLKDLFDLLCVLLWDALLEYLWHRLDKLFHLVQSNEYS